ncbi:MAG: DUF6034 family protein [Oscillospiraceae bacterium]|jgi:hypothetical protein|nr:DUF6034 family protein [Oscillospiraceae bacterium]
MKIKIFILCTILLILTSACQREFDDVDTDNGNDQNYSPVTPSQQPSADFEVPDHFIKIFDFENSSISVSIDASIDAKHEFYNNTYEIKQIPISQEKVDIIRNVLLPDTQIFSPPYYGTREEIIHQITYLEEALVNEIEDFNMSLIENYIEFLKEELYSAPSKEDLTPNDGKYGIRVGQDINGEKIVTDSIYIDVVADTGKINMATFHAQNIGDGNVAQVSFSNIDRGYAIKQHTENYNSISGMETSYEEAKNIAINALTDMGLDYLQTELSLKGTLFNPITESNENQFYKFYFTRNISGALVSLTEPFFSKFDRDNSMIIPNSYTQSLPEEFVMFMIDNSGIIGFQWYNPVEIIDISDKNVLLLPFNEIISILEEEIKTFINHEAMNIKISTIRLSMTRYTTNNTYIYVPVWDFLVAPNDDSINITGAFVFNGSQSFMTINALDGSIINRFSFNSLI